MFDVAPTELLLVVVVALVVIGPKDLPKAMRFVGKWMGKARGMARHFRAGLDTMMREAELEELEKQWREQNEAIMREFPRIDDHSAASPPPVTSAQNQASGKEAATDSGALTDSAPPETAVPAQSETQPMPDQPMPETHSIPPKDGPLP